MYYYAVVNFHGRIIMSQPVTLNQIAERVGVSPRTVANALGSRVPTQYARAAARAKRIRRIAQEMGYRPNAAARAMTHGRFHTIALLLPHDSQGYVPQGLMAGFNHSLEEAGYGLRVDILPDEDLADEQFMPRILSELAVDGLLINLLTSVPQGMDELIHRFNVPAIYINDDRPHDCVTPDEHDATRQATEHLIGLGHRRILLAQDAGAHYSDAARLAGYREAMTEAGLAPTTDLSNRYNIRSLQRDKRLAETCAWAEQLLAAPDRPTGILCSSEDAAEVLAAAGLRRGLELGADLSIITFGTNPSIIGGRKSTVMKLHTPGLGEIAVQMLMQKIAAPRKQFERRLYPRTLEIGQTTGPVNDK